MKNIKFFALAAFLRSRVHTRFSRIARSLSNWFHFIIPNRNTKKVWTFFIVFLLYREAMANSIAVGIVDSTVAGWIVFDGVLLSWEKFVVLSVASFLELANVNVRLEWKWVRTVNSTSFFTLNLRLVINLDIKILWLLVYWSWVLVHLFWSGAK